jgi:hypothetical protein
MNKNIEHYCLVIKGAIDKKTCKETINFLKKSKYQKHLFYSNTDGYQKLSKHKELEITYDQAPTYDKLMQAVYDCLVRYVNHVRLEFKIPYLNGWQGYTGDVIIFPSTFLYPHKVNEVKKGIRYSFVSWAW